MTAVRSILAPDEHQPLQRLRGWFGARVLLATLAAAYAPGCSVLTGAPKGTGAIQATAAETPPSASISQPESVQSAGVSKITDAASASSATATPRIKPASFLAAERPSTTPIDQATVELVDGVRATSYLAPLPPVESESPDNVQAEQEHTALEFSIDEALRQAESQHPELQRLRHEISMALAEVVGVDVYDNPELVLDTQSPLGDGGPTELTTRVEFALPRPGRRRARVAVANAGVARARAAYDRAAQQIRREVADNALNVAYLQELSALEANMAALGESRAESVTVETADQDDPGRNLVDRIEADVEAVAARARWLSTLTQLEVARVALSQAMGMPAEAPIRITDELASNFAPLPSWLAVLARARHVDPEIAEALATLRGSRQAHGLARLEAIPDAVMGPRFEDRLGEDDDQIGVRFAADVPVFNRNEGAICQTAAQVRRDQAGLRAAELNVLARLASIYRELASSHRQLAHFNTEVQAAIERHEATLDDPQLQGLISIDRTIAIQQELVRLKRQRLELRRRTGQLQIQLEQMLGAPLARLPMELAAGDQQLEEIPPPPTP